MWVRAHGCSAHGGQKRASGLLEREFQAVLTCPMWMVGGELRASGRAARNLSLPHTQALKRRRGRGKAIFLSLLIVVVKTLESCPIFRRMTFIEDQKD